MPGSPLPKLRVLSGREVCRILASHGFVEVRRRGSHVVIMTLNYSIYEAKARFFEIIRQVREGKTVTVSYRGEPVAEIRSVLQRRKPTLDERLNDLERRGCLVRPTIPRRMFQPVERRAGALSRFLAERGE